MARDRGCAKRSLTTVVLKPPAREYERKGIPAGVMLRLLVGPGACSLCLLKQAAGLGDEFCDFEGLHQVWDIVFL